MTTNLLIAIAAGLAALLGLLPALLIVGWRRDLLAARDRADEDGRRNRIFEELTGSIDLDEVLSRTLEAAVALTRADAALVVLPGSADGEPVVGSLGLSVDEVARHAVDGVADGTAAPTIARSCASSEVEREASAEDRIRARLAVALSAEGEPAGCLAVFTRSAGTIFDAAETRELESLAVRARPALENACRFREARRLADLDGLTGLHNRRFFHETLAREVARAHRYARRLALVVFDLDDFKAINDRVGHLGGDSVLAEAADRVREVVRSADIACRVGGDEFAVILPEATLEEADQLYNRIRHAVASRPIGNAGQVRLSAGAAELRREDDATSLFQRADDALYRAKDGGKGRVVIAAGGRDASQ